MKHSHRRKLGHVFAYRAHASSVNMTSMTRRTRGVSTAVITIIVVVIVGAASFALLGGIQSLGSHSTTSSTTTTSTASTETTSTSSSPTGVATTSSSTSSSAASSSSTQGATTSSTSSTATQTSSSATTNTATSATTSSSSTQSTTTSGSTATTSTSSSSTTSTETTSSAGSSSLEVASQFANGTAVVGVYTELALNGAEVATGYTPITFATTSGQNYTVTVSDSNILYFNRWSNNFSSRVIPIAADGSKQSLTAVFTTTPQPPPSTPYSITVDSNTLNGTAIHGYLIDLRIGGYAIQSGFTPVTFQNLEPGLEYQVVAYWAGNYFFRHFSDGDLNRYELVTLNSTGTKSVSFDAMYEYVPPSQAATLNVIAVLPNGTLLGTTFNNSDYIQHTPGMWTTVTPPGSTIPYTGTFTGGSLLPFVLFRGDTYTVQMTLAYGNLAFGHWNDTGSANATRVVTLDQNTTLVAVYEPTSSSNTMQAGSWSHMVPSLLVPFGLCLISYPYPSPRRDRRFGASSLAGAVTQDDTRVT
jgi:hypothetical protein